ncbi:MAG: hypothetical protein KDI92_09150 [Xanthomonadales bacterium]|nr:hypothetical protein [Xanthomonadales bacterium]
MNNLQIMKTKIYILLFLLVLNKAHVSFAESLPYDSVIGIWKTIEKKISNLKYKKQKMATVGSGDSCDYKTIQSGLDSGASTIFVTNSGAPYYENLKINARDIQILGGYENCLAVIEGKAPKSNTVINGSKTGSVITILENEKFSDEVVMSFKRLKFENGLAEFGGGISLGPKVIGIIELADVVINNNVATYDGGGIYVNSNSSLSFWLTHSLVSENQAQYSGGGIYCKGKNSFLFNKNNIVNANDASYGGGINADSCLIQAFTPFEMSENYAKKHGGAMLAYFGQIELYGFQLCYLENFCFGEGFQPILIKNNTAGTTVQQGYGGGFYFDGNSEVTLKNLLVYENQADVGGAFAVFGKADVLIEGEKTLCRRREGCNHYFQNRAQIGGVFSLFDEAKLTTANTVYYKNLASQGVILAHQVGHWLYSNPTELIMEGNLIYSNGIDGDMVNLYTNDELFLLRNNSVTNISFTTIAKNKVTKSVFNDNGKKFQLMTSIINEDLAIYTGGGSEEIWLDCLLVSENNSLPPGGTINVGDAKFVNSDLFDFHLTSQSQAIDFCDDMFISPNYLDMDGHLRGVDYIPKSNIYGVYDLGFDEFL